MPRKPKTVKIEAPSEETVEVEVTAPETDERSAEVAALLEGLRANGSTALNGYEVVIVKSIPNAKANNSIRFPITVEDEEKSVEYIIEKISESDKASAETLSKIYKRSKSRTGATLYLRLRLLELEA